MSNTQDILFYVECYSNNCDEIPLHETRCIMCYLAYCMIVEGGY